MRTKRGKTKKARRMPWWLLVTAALIAPIAGAIVFNLDRLGQYHRLKQFLPASLRARLSENQAALTLLPPGAELKARVVDVSDGDTLTVLSLDGKNRYPLRLAGADAPEKSQRFGEKALDRLQKYYGRVVDVEIIDNTADNLNLARVYYDNKDINLEMVAAGLAWYDASSLPASSGMQAAESQARRSGTGLWSDPEPVKPPTLHLLQ